MIADGATRDAIQRVVDRAAPQAVLERRGAEQRLDRGLRDQLRFRATFARYAAAGVASEP